MWAFDGVVGAAIIAVIGFSVKSFLFRGRKRSNGQRIRSGKNSTNIQAGGDVTYEGRPSGDS